MKTSLVFDLNYILYKNVFTLCKLKTLYGDFHRMMTNNITKFTSMHQFDTVWMASDSNTKSWRKLVFDEYKAHRKKSEDVDWDWVFKAYDEWKDFLKDEYGFPVMEGKHIEGDDWITSIIAKNNAKSISTVLIASDGDLKQHLNYSIGKKEYINIQIDDKGGNEKVYVPLGYNIYTQHIEENSNEDVFVINNDQSWKNFLNRATTMYNCIEVDAREILFTKIVKGDGSDNIPSVWQKVLKTGKIQNIGDAGAAKVWDFYRLNYDVTFDTKDEQFAKNLINCIEKVNNVSFNDDIKDSVTSNINRNVSLIELNHRHFPEQVVETIIEQMTSVLQKA